MGKLLTVRQATNPSMVEPKMLALVNSFQERFFEMMQDSEYLVFGITELSGSVVNDYLAPQAMHTHASVNWGAGHSPQVNEFSELHKHPSNPFYGRFLEDLGNYVVKPIIPDQFPSFTLNFDYKVREFQFKDRKTLTVVLTNGHTEYEFIYTLND